MAGIVSTLFPPKLVLRTRSLSFGSISSPRSPTPASSVPPTPLLVVTSPSAETARPPPLIEFIQHVHDFPDYLDAPALLSLSSVARTHQCLDLRSVETFLRHLRINGWDTDSLKRRGDMPPDSNARPWMRLARSALGRARIVSAYLSLPKEGDRSSSQQEKKAAHKFFRTILDIATEHDDRNFTTFAALASMFDMSLVLFVTNVRAPDWKARYRKTFFVATLINSQPPQPNVSSDIEALAETLDFKQSQTSLATRANFLYAYGCTNRLICGVVPSAHRPLPSTAYDPPHMPSADLPGVQRALGRFAARTAVAGFYRRSSAGGTVVALHVEFAPRAASGSRLSFADRDRLALTATMRESSTHLPWTTEGVFNLKTGVGKFQNASGEIHYDIWVTPWGLVGEKTRRGGTNVGYFVLHWTAA